MSDFLNFVLSYLRRGIILSIFPVALGGIVLYFAAKRYKAKHGPESFFPWKQAILVLMLMGYLVMVLFVTVRGGGFYSGRANLHLFRAWREAWNSFSERQWLNILLNIAMFVPLGILVPLIWPGLRKGYRMLPVAFGASLSIEIIQFITGSGLFDVDDLFTNTLGAAIGFCAVLSALSLGQQQWRKCLGYTLALLSAAAAVGSIFIVYDLQEYGNLPTAPAFRVSTGDVQWTVSCPLKEAEQQVDIYRTKPWSKAQCEAFGRAFLENLGVSQVDVTIYNDEVYLREAQGNQILEVYYQDGHYSYANLGMCRDFVQTDAQTLRNALLEYGIEIPDSAVFSCSDGITHCFRVEQHPAGDSLLDGTVAVRYEESIGICSIDNSLVSVTYYGSETVIPEKEAVRRVTAGNLANGEWFERNRPEQLEIRSCELSYQVDTKGFYQPVYLVEIYDPETGHLFLEAVPAIA